jgi:hypothetical protein
MNLNPTAITTPGTAVAPVHAITLEAGEVRATAVTDSDQARWRSELETLWTRKLDEVIALSKAIYSAAPAAGDELAAAAVLPPPRLRSRADRACEQLADVEEAIARVSSGSYGYCAACNEPMTSEWLAGQPQIRHCRDCSLSQTASPADAATNELPRRVPAQAQPAVRPRGRPLHQAAAKTLAPVG